MVTFPLCKINLGLQILSKRTDGYHSIATCFYPLPWTDVLEILPAESFTWTQSGIAIPGKPTDNLCIKAYQLLKNQFNLPPIQIHLHKIVPTGAGLGGGSSDAASTLKSVNSVFNLGLSNEQLSGYASQLGSDCAFFLHDTSMIGSGRGEILEPLPLTLKGFYAVLIIPDIHISTQDAYARVDPSIPTAEVRQIIEQPLGTWRGKLKNDFEPSVFKSYPAIKNIKEQLYSLGALYASMSGSGSSVYGIFEKEIQMEDNFKNTVHWSGWL